MMVTYGCTTRNASPPDPAPVANTELPRDRPAPETRGDSLDRVDGSHVTPKEIEASVRANKVGLESPPKRPWSHNTGPTDTAALRPSSSFKITTDGAVFEDLDVAGMITIDANDVVIRNFRINATGALYGIRVLDGHSGILLEDGELFGMDSAGILGVGFEARHLHIHSSNSDGLKVQGTGGPTLVEHSFIEKLCADGKGHCDGNQTRGGSKITFRYNNIYLPYPGTPSYQPPYKSNSTFIIELATTDFVIENNWLTGGNYTIYCQQKGGTVIVRNNTFGRENGGLAAGKEALRLRAGRCGEWSGNRWEDTGEPI